MRVGIFLPNWIGDVVMATPTLRALRRYLGPQAYLVGIARPYVEEVLAGTSWLDECLRYERQHDRWGWLRSPLVKELRSRELDAILLLTNSLRTAYFAWQSRAPRRLGYARGGRSWLLTDRLPVPRLGWRFQPISAVDYYLRLVDRFTGRDVATDTSTALTSHAFVDRHLELATTRADEEAADTFWQRHGWTATTPTIVLNTGGAYGAAKQWPEESFTALAQRFVAETDGHVVINCGPSERWAAERIATQANSSRVVSLASEPLGIGLSKAIIRRSQLLVSTDSGPRHLGAAFGVPTVSLFGPTDPRWSMNYHAQSIDLQRHVPCGPCARRKCPLGHHRCMRELSVEQVFQAARQLMQTPSTADKAA